MVSLRNEVVATRASAMRLARVMGCTGAHEMPNGWHPCASHEELNALINGGARRYRLFRSRNKALDTTEFFSDPAAALKQAIKNGCHAIRVVMIRDEKFYKPCPEAPIVSRQPAKPAADGWEGLRQEPVQNLNGSGPGLTS